MDLGGEMNMSQQAQMNQESWDIRSHYVKDVAANAQQSVQRSAQNSVVPTGYAELDAILPNGGWPCNELVEIISNQWSTAELQLILPLIKSVIDQDKWILWIAPPQLPCGPLLVSAGIDITRIVAVHPQSSCCEAFANIDEALKDEDCGLVIAWLDWLPNSVVRRIQLATRRGNKPGLLFRQHENKLSPAVLRLQTQAETEGLSVTRLKTTLAPQTNFHRDYLRARTDLHFTQVSHA